jgi:hypothetical protein
MVIGNSSQDERTLILLEIPFLTEVLPMGLFVKAGKYVAYTTKQGVKISKPKKNTKSKKRK